MMSSRAFCWTVAVCIALIAGALPGHGGEIVLTWSAPTHNVDGTALTDLAGVKLYYGTSSSNYPAVIDVGYTNAYTITGLVAGSTYYLNGTAYNVEGRESAFCDEVIKVAGGAPPSGNQPPQVDAGADRDVIYGSAVALEALVDDDGLPAGSTTTVQWSKQEGPGTVQFSDSQAAGTSATFSRHGRYVLYVSASDGEKASTDILVVNVLAVPAPPSTLRIRSR